MAINGRYAGLCETCEHDAGCTLRRSMLLKIVQCEQYSINAESYAAVIQRDPVVAGVALAAVCGLCANCLHVLTCAFPDARRHVVHCEEYILDEAGVVAEVPVSSRSAA